MDKITDVKIGPLSSSQYMSPLKIYYKQNGIEKTWDALIAHDSIIILIYNEDRDAFVLVKQFRPAVYLHMAGKTSPVCKEEVVDTTAHPGSLGVTYELCAGLVDKDKPLAEIAQEEILEECGYKVPLDKVERVASFRSSVGISGGEQTMFYARVTDEMRVSSGGGNPEEGEYIEVVEMPVKDSLQFCLDESKTKPLGMISAIYWFHQYKMNK